MRVIANHLYLGKLGTEGSNPSLSASFRSHMRQTATSTPQVRRALVLDDDEGIRIIVSHTLTRAGWSVETVTNGRQGLKALMSKTFDVAVVDIRMQEMDGFTFIREAKKIWPWQGFVLISGFLDDESVATAREEGLRHMLKKPLLMSDLLAAVEDEAAHRADISSHESHRHSRELISYQLNMMRHITRDALTTRDLPSALTSLGRTINEMLAFDIMGILCVEENESPLILLQCNAQQSTASASMLKSHIIDRYHALSGKSLDENALRTERVGSWSDAATPNQFASLVCVPIITGEDVHGILAIGSRSENAFDEMMIAILYHTAGVLSTMLTAYGEMRSLAIRDALTGLFNRRHLEEELARSWQLSNRYKHPMAVMMIDIDQFKNVNDRYGHQAGDQLLKEFVTALQDHVRGSDILARYGGDEFVIILPQANHKEADGLAHRMLDTIRTKRFLNSAGGIALTSSIGIAIHDPNRPLPSHQDLMHQADEALYRVKNAGRNDIQFHDQPAATSSSADVASIKAPQKTRGRILVLDDEPSILDVLKMVLSKSGFSVDTARTIQECMDHLKGNRGQFDVMLCDLTLPDGHGLDMIRWARELEPEMISIIITGNATAENAIKALQEGAYDFITKPILRSSMLAAIDRALAYRALVIENKRYREHLEEVVRVKHAELAQALDSVKRSYQFSLETMVAMLDSREFETGQHSLRVRELTMALAGFMGYEGAVLEELGRGALLHDIGKIGIPDAVLLKPGKLSDEEWAIMRKHPEIGYRFLKNSEFLKTAAGIVLSHHEAWDGSGYPHGLKGEEINPGARIFSVIDAYDAMRSPRVYKNSIPVETALADLKQKAGQQFDPHVVAMFEQFLPTIERIGGWPK